MQTKQDIAFSDVEWRIMRALWKLGAPTLGEIVREVKDAGWTRHAVISFLKRLETKGYVRVDASQRPGRYMAAVTGSEARRSDAHQRLRNVYGGNLMLMVTNAVMSGELTDEETQQLIDILQKGEKGHEDRT